MIQSEEEVAKAVAVIESDRAPVAVFDLAPGRLDILEARPGQPVHPFVLEVFEVFRIEVHAAFSAQIRFVLNRVASRANEQERKADDQGN